MSLSHRINISPHHHINRQNHHSASPSSLKPPAASLHKGAGIVSHSLLHNIEETKDRIRSLFNRKVDLSVSSYDTAWVAMLPSPNNSQTPFFPQCLHWLLHNQLRDGSWGLLLHRDPLLVKDALSSTLASVLALKLWGVGEQQINHGLEFIESNFASATDKDQHSPVGFDIIFPGMLEQAKSMDLRLPLDSSLLNTMLLKKESELRRCYESHAHDSESYLAYVSEGLGNLQDWEMVMKYQMKNGSILNSPSTTAAVLAHHHRDGCLDYLVSLLDRFGDAVPTVHPLDLYVRLCMVDNLERLGIGRHFRVEIESILDETFRCWQLEDEQIFMDVTTCATAFRLLRLNGYDVSSDRLSEVANRAGNCFSSLAGNSKDLSAALEVYKASQIVISVDELSLIEQNSRSRSFLEQKLSDTSFPCDALTKDIIQEVNHALKFSLDAVPEFVARRRYIEDYSIHSPRILKTSYWSSNINNRDFLKLAVEDYNACQSIYRDELEYMKRWTVETKLNVLNVRQREAYSYLTGITAFISPELSDARLSCAKNVNLTTAVDDFFDVAGSMEELVNLIQLVESWEVDIDKECCSEHVHIIFLAIKRVINEAEEDALKCQARSVKSHMIETWLACLKSMLQEAVWARDGTVPKMEEYITNGYLTIAGGPVTLLSLYLVGPKLSEEMFQTGGEIVNIFKLVSTISRLMNDTATFKREFEQGKLNAVTLKIIHGNGEVDEKEAIREIKIWTEKLRRELLRLVLNEKGSVVPRVCKDVFWNINIVANLFYANNDRFTSDELHDSLNSIFDEPISIVVDSD